MPAGVAAPPILASSRQTRFHLSKDDASKEVDIKDLSITLATSAIEDASPAAKTKGKAKARTEGLEILVGAHLRLKTGVHYALVGRNGTGKSTLLRALTTRVIPGVQSHIRIASLQQTANTEQTAGSQKDLASKTVLEHVIHGDPYRNLLIYELEVISNAMEENNPVALVRASRKIQHERLQREFDEVERMARLRSGARGLEARKILIEFEKKVEASAARLIEDESEISTDTIQEEADHAAALQTDLQLDLETVKLADIERNARHVLSGLGFKEEQLGQTFSTLSGGWQMRCLLATALVQTADLLVLDEPTNYLDLLGILWLQHYIISLETSMPDKTVLLVSHDRDFLNAVCSETIVLRDQSLTYHSGNLDSYEKSVRHETLRMSRMKESQEKQIAHMEKTIQESKKQAKKAGDDSKMRQAKSRQKKLDERMGMEVNANGHRFRLNDRAGFFNTSKIAIEVPKEERGVSMTFPPAPDLRFPGSLLSMENASFSYPRSKKRVIENATVVVHTGDRVGVLGLNGAGKSTLVQLLVEQLKPSAGTITRHPRLKVGYYSQHSVDTLKTLAEQEEALTALALVMRRAQEQGHALPEPDARKLLGSLGLQGRTASETPVSKLSGGQLVRLALALLFLDPPHVFILDEPTTHLDLPTVLALGQALRAYDGAIVLVTHDRFFMRFVVEGQARSAGDDSDDSDSGGNEDVEAEHVGRRIVYEVKAAKVLEKAGGVDKWETGLEGRLRRLKLL